MIGSEKGLTINLFSNSVGEESGNREAINILLFNSLTEFNFTKLVYEREIQSFCHQLIAPGQNYNGTDASG